MSTPIVNAVNEFVSTVCTEHSTANKKATAQTLSAFFQTPDVQTRLTETVRKHMPRRTRDTTHRVKDPNAPRRPFTAYLLFSKDRRPHIKSEHQEFSSTQIMRELGAQWQTLSAEQKQPYVHKSQLDKERYEREKKSYVPPPVDDDVVVEVVGKRKRAVQTAPDGTVIKRKSGYQLFIQENRASHKEEHPDLQPKDLMSSLGHLWSSLSAEEKEPYNVRAKQMNTAQIVQEPVVSQPAPVVVEVKEERKHRKPREPKAEKPVVVEEKPARSKSEKQSRRAVVA